LLQLSIVDDSTFSLTEFYKPSGDHPIPGATYEFNAKAIGSNGLASLSSTVAIVPRMFLFQLSLM